VRRYLPLVASVWLLFQAGVIAATPFIDCCASASEATADDDACCKGLAPGQMCPLHKHRHAPKSGTQHHDEGGPAIRCGCTVLDPALASLAFGLGEPPSSVSATVIPFSHPVRHVAFAAIERAHSLDPPPPR
jgi:hypothetical protein